MKCKATSPSRAVDLRDRCKWLNLTAECEKDEAFLSKLYQCVFHGGRVTLREKKTNDKPMTAISPKRRKKPENKS